MWRSKVSRLGNGAPQWWQVVVMVGLWLLRYFALTAAQHPISQRHFEDYASSSYHADFASRRKQRHGGQWPIQCPPPLRHVGGLSHL
jgi:hypothetical protein